MAETIAQADKTTQIHMGSGLDGLIAGANAASKSGAGRPLPPVEQWNPPFCGDIDMRIAADGTWFYTGTPIGRPALVKLFASILRRDADRFVLVTPVERVGIKVDDAPFVAVEMAVHDRGDRQTLRLRTNVDDWVDVDRDHAIRFETGAADGIKPYVRVRGGLWALLSRQIFLDLVEIGEIRDEGGVEMFGVASAGCFFAMAAADSVEGLREGR